MNYKASFKRITNNKTLVNESLFSLFSFFSQECGFLVLILVAGYILPTDYGRLSIFNTIVAFLTYVVGFSTNSYVSVSYFREPRDIFKKDFTAIILIFVSSLIFFLLLQQYYRKTQYEVQKSLDDCSIMRSSQHLPHPFSIFIKIFSE